MRGLGEKKASEGKPGQKEFESALESWDKGDTEQAIVEFKKALERGFKSDSIENDLGACYEKLGKMEEAKEHYSKSLEINPNNFYALKNMGEMFSSEGKWEEAKPLFKKANAIDPADGGVSLGLARCMIASGEMEKAIRMIVRRSKETEDPQIFLGFLRILNDVGAHSEIVKAMKNLPESLQDDSETLFITGKALLEVGQSADAVAKLQKVYDRDPSAEATSWLGLALMSSGLEEIGLEMLKKATEQDQNNIQLFRNYSFALHGSDRLEEALSVYERAIAIEPDEWVLWNNWGNALYNLGRYVESIPKFITAIEKNPDYEIAWNNIGNALEKMHLYAESLPFHYRAIEIDEEFDYAHYAAAMGLVMTGYEREGKKALAKSMSLAPRFPEAWMLKARLLMKTAPDEASVYAEEAVSLDPSSPEPMIILAMCQALAGQLPQSEMTLRHARELALASDEKEIVNEIDMLLVGGPDQYSGIIGSSKEEAKSAVMSYDHAFGDSLQWYKAGSEMYARGKRKRALNALKLAHDMDRESVAVISMLLRAETNEVRLAEFLRLSEDLASKGLATPHLQRSIEAAKQKIGKAG